MTFNGLDTLGETTCDVHAESCVLKVMRFSRIKKSIFSFVSAFCNQLAFLLLEEEQKTALKALIGGVLAAASASLWHHSSSMLSVTSPPVCWLSDIFHHISVDWGKHHVVAAPRFYSIYAHDFVHLHIHLKIWSRRCCFSDFACGFIFKYLKTKIIVLVFLFFFYTQSNNN